MRTRPHDFALDFSRPLLRVMRVRSDQRMTIVLHEPDGEQKARDPSRLRADVTLHDQAVLS